MTLIVDSNIVYVNHKVPRPESRDKLPVDTPENPTYVKTSLTNEDIDYIEEILPPLSYDYEIWNMDNETLIDSGHYNYPEDVEN